MKPTVCLNLTVGSVQTRLDPINVLVKVGFFGDGVKRSNKTTRDENGTTPACSGTVNYKYTTFIVWVQLRGRNAVTREFLLSSKGDRHGGEKLLFLLGDRQST